MMRIGLKQSNLARLAASRSLKIDNMRFLSSQHVDHLQNAKLWKTSGYIGGKWTDGTAKGKFSVKNPTNGETIAELPRMNAADVAAAAKISFVAWKKWGQTLSTERAKILRKMATLMGKYRSDLAAIITLESGKPLSQSEFEVDYAKAFLVEYAEEANRITGQILEKPLHGSRVFTIKQSVGPAALITPWNFPSAMVTRKLGPALAAGCSVIMKPSEETPLSALALCAIAEEAGMPPGVVNCLTVAREEVHEVGLALCHDLNLRKLSFTGSTEVGKWLMRESSSTVKRLSLELGGNAPFIVFDDADLEIAVSTLMPTKFRNSGQACIAANRILVHESVYDKFAHLLVEQVAKLKCGPGFQSTASTLGPLINQKAVDKVTAHVQDCLSKGARALIGGTPHKELNAAGGTFFNPTVLVDVTRDMLPFKEETFGPVLALLKFSTEEEAIEIANDTRYGLAGYACTRDLCRVWRVAEALEFGMVGINEHILSGAAAPFGGMKESGLGKEGGHWGIDEYLESKYVCIGLGDQSKFN